MSTQGEIPYKVKEAIKELGREPSAEEMVQIKKIIVEGIPVVVVEPSKEQKLEAKVRELTESSSRRDLEAKLRELGIEPDRQTFPDKQSLAKAIVKKEAET